MPAPKSLQDPVVGVAEPASMPVASAAEPAQDDEPKVAVSDVDVMLSMLAAEHRQNDSTAGLAEHMSEKSTRMMVMFGGMLVIGLVGFLLLTLLGAIV